jgi:ATP-dependent DNA ligase
MFLETVNDFISEIRIIIKQGGRGSRKNAESLCGRIIGVHLLSQDETIESITSALCTLYPYFHPERFTPIGLSTMAYIIQAAVDEKFAGKKAQCCKGENPFDYVSSAGLDLLCSSTNKGITTCAVQRALNMMCTATNKAKHHTLIHILSECSVEQGRLLCEMMSCTLTFGMGVKRFIENLGCHEKDQQAVQAASKTLYMTNNLSKVSQALLDGVPAPLEVGYYISSMLARQKAFHDPLKAFDFILKSEIHAKNNINQTNQTKGKRKREIDDDSLLMQNHTCEFVAQIKIDGYRVQLHRKAGNINRVWYFSRQGLNLAESYHFNVLDECILKSMGKDIDFILDGEIIAMNKKTNEFVPCSDMAACPWLKNDDIKLMYFVFDVLFIDNVTYIDDPYSKRLKIMKEKVKQNENIVPVLDSVSLYSHKTSHLAQSITSQEEISLFYDIMVNVLDLEGVMIKSLHAPWKPYERSNSQVKVKPKPNSYNLYIVGANVNRAQLISSVLLAHKSEPCKSESETKKDENEHYYAMTMCGTGLTARARARLTEWFFERNRSSTRGSHHVPSYLHVLGGSDKPHMYLCDTPIECRVTAQKMTDSKVYAHGKTLRFPVLRAIPTIQFDAEDENGNMKSWKNEADSALPIETGFVNKENDILINHNVWVVPTKDESLYSELIRHILRMGGHYDKEPNEHTTHFVVPDIRIDEQALSIAQIEYPGIPSISANWLRNCFLWNVLNSFENFKI